MKVPTTTKIVHNEPSKRICLRSVWKNSVKHSKPEDNVGDTNGIIYDLTNFISQHPGGPEIIKANCGHDF